MRVLVTGGAGFIGSHVSKALARAGHETLCFDNLAHGHREAVRWSELIEGDILDKERLDSILRRFKPHAVMHLAAFAYVGESVTDPLKYYRNNISGTISLLEAMQRNGVGAIVFSSSCATYGVPASLPITEQTPQRPINPYGYTKLAIEHALEDCGHAHGLRWVALRYFNAAGADPDGEVGERHDPETHALPLAINAALGKGGPFLVHGTDYETPDGTAVRDYVHVSDIANAHVQSLEFLAAGGESGAFNLATGRGVSVKQLIDAVQNQTNQIVPVQYGPRRSGDPPALYASAAKAQSMLGWRPTFVDFNGIVDTAVRWFRS